MTATTASAGASDSRVPAGGTRPTAVSAAEMPRTGRELLRDRHEKREVDGAQNEHPESECDFAPNQGTVQELYAPRRPKGGGGGGRGGGGKCAFRLVRQTVMGTQKSVRVQKFTNFCVRAGMAHKTLSMGRCRNCPNTHEKCPISGGGKPSTEIYNASPRR